MPQDQCAGRYTLAAGDQAGGGVRDLVDSGATQLSHAFRQQIEPVYIGFGQAAAGGVDRQASAQLEVAILGESAAFTPLADRPLSQPSKFFLDRPKHFTSNDL